MNSEQSSNGSNGPPRSTANPLNKNPPIPQNMKKNYPSLPPQVGVHVIPQNPTMEIPQQANDNPVQQLPYQSQRTQHMFPRFYKTLPNLQPPRNVGQSSSNYPLPSEQKGNGKSENLLTEQANCPRSNESTNESQFSNTEESDIKANFALLNKLSILDVENMSVAAFTEYVTKALLCAENIANRNEKKYCFRNIESICRRTRQEVEKKNFTARNLCNQGYPFAIKDLIFSLARSTNCWRILSGYYQAIKINSLKGRVNSEISDDFLKCFAEWEKINKKLTHNLFKTFSNLDVLHSKEEAYRFQNERSNRRYTDQPYEEQCYQNQEASRRSEEKPFMKNENTGNTGKEQDQSGAWGISRLPEYKSSGSGENKKAPVHQDQSVQSWVPSPEEDKSPSTNFVYKAEQFPALGERIKKYNRQSSMENGSPSSSTGAIRKKIKSNVKAEENSVNHKQVATSQTQTYTGPVVTDSNEIKNTPKIEYVSPSNKAIVLRKNQMHQVGAHSGAIEETRSVGIKQEPMLSHHEQIQTHLVQPWIQTTGSNSGVTEVTANHGYTNMQTSPVNQGFSTGQMQYPITNPGLGRQYLWTANEYTSAGYHQDNRFMTHQTHQPLTMSAGLRSNFTEMTNYNEQQPLTNTYLQSSGSYQSQYNADQTTANYGYECGSGEPSRRGSGEPSRRGSGEPSRRGSYEPSNSGSFESSRPGSHEPSRRGSYESSRGQAYEPSRRGRYHDHFAYNRGISLIPKGYNYLVQFSYKAMNIDKYEEQLLKDAELLAKNTAMTILNDQNDDTNFNTQLKAKHSDAKILSIKLKKIWIKLEETYFMFQNIQKSKTLVCLYYVEMNKPENLTAIGNRILNLHYTSADQFVTEMRDILFHSAQLFANDIGYQINLAMFEITFKDLLKEVFPDLSFNFLNF